MGTRIHLKARFTTKALSRRPIACLVGIKPEMEARFTTQALSRRPIARLVGIEPFRFNEMEEEEIEEARFLTLALSR